MGCILEWLLFSLLVAHTPRNAWLFSSEYLQSQFKITALRILSHCKRMQNKVQSVTLLLRRELIAINQREVGREVCKNEIVNGPFLNFQIIYCC